MKVGIFGLGVFGTQLATHLSKSGIAVEGTVRTENKARHFATSGIRTSILSVEANSKIILSSDFLASDVFVLNYTPSGLSGFFFEKHQEICALLPLTSKVIFISSTRVYTPKEGFVDENSFRDETHVLTSTENMLREILGDRLTILRPAGLFGVGRNPARFLSGKRALENANQVVNLVHLVDLVRFTHFLVLNNFWGETVNVCASEHPTRKECYTMLCEKLNLTLPQFLPDLENKQGKLVSNQKSIEMGFEYLADNPLYFEEE